MPHITTEKVAIVRQQLKEQFPDFKFSVRRDRDSTIDIAVLAGPIDFGSENATVNVYWIADHWKDNVPAMEFLLKVHAIANDGNRIVSQDGDYGNIPKFYVDMHIGRYETKYKIIEKQEAIASPCTAQTLSVTGATITHNIDKGGIEIRFASKPSDEILRQFNLSPFRWSRFSKCWWAKISHRSMTFAEQWGKLPHTISGESNDDGALVEAQENAYADNNWNRIS